MMMLRTIQSVHENAASAPRPRRCRRDPPRAVACRAEERASTSSSAPRSRGESSEDTGGRARAAAACAAAVLSLVSGPQPALAGGYGTGFSYFEALERERAISEEAVPLSSRDRRRANAPSVDAASVSRRGIPLSLGSLDDGSDDSKVVYSDPGGFEYSTRTNEKEWWKDVPREKWARAAFQWSVIFLVAYNVRASRTRGSAVTKRLGLTGAAGKALIGTRWKLTLDIGRERGTWMPPEWGASGRRILCPVAVELKEGGVAEPVAVGAFLPMTLSSGKWRLEGDALKFSVGMSGMSRGDIVLPEDELHFRTAAWGSTVASKGNLLLLQTRFGFRKEWRMAGVFKAEPLLDGDDLSGDEEDLYEENMKKVVKDLGAMRVSERKTE
jgi:hypothetical protein